MFDDPLSVLPRAVPLSPQRRVLHLELAHPG
jgi:hypothetical protein